MEPSPDLHGEGELVQREPSQDVLGEVSILTMCQERSLCTKEITKVEMTPIAHEVIVNTSYEDQVRADETFSSEVFEPLTETGIRASDAESSTTEATDSESSDEENSIDGFASEPNGMSPWSNKIQSLKSKRPDFEECLICGKSVKKMRDHLTNAHRLDKNPRIKQFLGSFYSTLNTKRCFQCTICPKRMSFKEKHPKHHKLQRIFNRADTKLFPMEVQLCIRRLKESLAKPYADIIEQFNVYTQVLADDGGIVSVSTLSATLKVFLGQVVLDTKQFSATTGLAVCVRKFKEDHSLKRITISNYLCKLKKFMGFVELHALDIFPDYRMHPWEKVLAEVRSRYQGAAQKEKRLKTKELYAKVPTLQEVQEINFLVQDFLNSHLTERALHYRELSTLNFLILSFRLNCRAGRLLNLTWDDVRTI